LADITPRVEVILISFVRGEGMSAGLNSLGGVPVGYHFVA